MSKFGQSLGKVWAKFGQSLGNIWEVRTKFGQVQEIWTNLGKVWAKFGQCLGKFRQSSDKVWASLGKVWAKFGQGSGKVRARLGQGSLDGSLLATVCFWLQLVAPGNH